jgi:hypothetical protein
MAKCYVCKGCDKGCDKGDNVMHMCDQACSDCTSIPPCAFADVRILCESCNRTSEVRHVSTGIKQISCGERPFAKRREIVSSVVCFSHVKNMNALSRTVKTVMPTKRSGISAI